VRLEAIGIDYQNIQKGIFGQYPAYFGAERSCPNYR
jgi:hypothetical protein